MEKSLFISSFDYLLYRVYGAARHHWGLGSYYIWYYALLFFLFLLLALLWHRFWPRLRPRWWNFSMAVLVVLLARVFLFDTPFAWHDYGRVAAGDSLSYLTALHRIEEIRTRELIPHKLNYLIVGSSLAERALTPYLDMAPDSRLLYIYGMRVAELAFCESKIRAFNPSRILLYMTNYDLSNIPWGEKHNSFYSFRDYKFGLYCDKKEFFEKSLAGYIFPEYRYACIFRAYLEDWLGRPLPKQGAGQTPEEFLKFKIEGQKRVVGFFTRNKVELNLLYLNKFLLFCRDRRINVIMLEGNINPLAETPQSRELGHWAIGRVKEMADQYEHVRFVPASELVRLEPEDFQDMIHANEEASRKFSECVFKYLQEHPPFPKR